MQVWHKLFSSSTLVFKAIHAARRKLISYSIAVKLIPIFSVVLGASYLLSACQSVPEKTVMTDAPIFAEPERAELVFSGETLYDALVAEVGARQGFFDESLPKYQTLSTTFDEPHFAERAARIATFKSRWPEALSSAKRWVELAPNHVQARQLLGTLHVREGNADLAVPQFDAMVKLLNAKQEDGLLAMVAALNGEKDAAALQVISTVAKNYPATSAASYALGLAHVSHREYQAAETFLQQAIEQDPDANDARVLLVRVLGATDRKPQAEAIVKAGLKRDAKNVSLQLSYARLLLSQERFDESLEAFGKAHEMAPGRADVTYAYAMLATQESKWSLAQTLWQTLRNDPKHQHEATFFLAQIEEQLDNDELAAGLYRAVGEGEHQTDALLRLSVVLLRQEKGDEALKVLAELRQKISPVPARLFNAEAQIMRQLNKADDEIEAVYLQGLEQHPTNKDLLFNYGLFISDSDDVEKMDRTFKKLLDLYPGDPDALNGWGYSLVVKGIRLQEARTYIEEAVKKSPENPAIVDSMGWVTYKLGDPEAALPWLERAFKLAADGEIGAHIVEVLAELGRVDEAKTFYAKVVAEFPDHELVKAIGQKLWPQ